MGSVAGEVRTSLALELARRGWRASVELVGPISAPVVAVSVEEASGQTERRWSAAVTDAPVGSQVRALLDHLDPTAIPEATGCAPDRWCAAE